MLNSEDFLLNEDKKGTKNAKQFGNSVILNYPCSISTDCTNYFAYLEPGTYAFETWGAQGGLEGGNGGYAFGIIGFSRKTKIEIFIGAKGDFLEDKMEEIPASFNGGGRAFVAWTEEHLRHAGAGGGATDIRVTPSSLNSRIIVGGGGGGSVRYESESTFRKGGYGGGTSGGDAEQDAKGATQGSPGIGTYSYKTCNSNVGTYSGAFGYGGESTCNSTYGGGGGGWYGGSSGHNGEVGPGGGGSGYVLTKDSLKPQGYFKHFSYYYMTNSKLINGDNDMPKCEGELDIHKNTASEKGHEGHGCARITIISQFFPKTCINIQKQNNLIYIFLLFYPST